MTLHGGSLSELASTTEPPRPAISPSTDLPSANDDEDWGTSDEDSDDVDGPDEGGGDDDGVEEISFFGDAPKGFALHMSPFALLWTLLGEWVTRATVLYLKGRPVPHYAAQDSRSHSAQQSLSSLMRSYLPSIMRSLGLKAPLSSLEVRF